MNEVEEVKNKTDIVSLIGEHVHLVKAGRNFKGLCPFHEERSPSFMVNPELQIYKCFGCGESGDVYTFLQKYEGMDFYEALQYLAEKTGVQLTKRQTKDTSIKPQIFEANKLAAQFYHYILINHQRGKEGIDYISGKRGLDLSTIKAFTIGYAPKSPTLLFDTLTKKKKISPNVLEQAGLVFKTERGYLDRFRERIIFPIYNHRGEPIALAGRILPQYDSGKVGKYINSPETPVYHKSSSLYGINISKDEIRKTKTAVVVEGELDLLTLWQIGVKNVVAIKGTAMTQEHVRILSRYADTLIMALDSDFAGDMASLKGLSFAQNAGLEIKIVNLGEYKDPDEFARANPEGIIKAVRAAGDAWEFVINLVSKRYDLSSGSGKAKASRFLVPVFATIQDNIVRSHYLQKTATKFGVPVEAVESEVSKYTPQKIHSNTQALTVKIQKTRRQLLEERLIALYILEPTDMKINEELFKTEFLLEIIPKLNDYSFESEKNTLEFVKSLPAHLSDKLSEIVLEVSDINIKDIELEKKTIEHELREILLREKISQTANLLAQNEREGNKKKLKMLEKQFQRLSQELSDIQKVE